ncbi:flagellar basal body P-ring protein FlgI [Porticoccaceae bacterium]|nr:flagellar basal body P-ring protein FlgI [Porticoccaceae bacterium]MDA8663718.1 flagellar basal body P-ring protein FlgI [Porticoccaceae bacterium]MDA8682708.1 flagellar basal body P-ring protein FlgI [Porticoccaceae bacterium]MDB2343702.1 flagellar basal body P-ring protein FlgI [Porticoccaceae bacterium]MDB2635044.1 flagellar basal body P-ring protein FlgI [Porticoccaceae bacterium]
MLRIKLTILCLALMFSSGVDADRIKDLTNVAGVRTNKLIGFGLVVGLQATGDGKDIPLTAQQLKTTLSGLGVSVDGPVSDFDLGSEMASLASANAKKEMKLENVAAVMVTAELPPFAKPGQKIDIGVSAIGTAESLRGGSLILTQLRGVDGQTYALAQGALTITGVSAESSGTSVQVGIPTAGRIPNGATVERAVATPFDTADHIVLNLRESDFSTANAVKTAIDESFGAGTAHSIDAVSIAVKAPADSSQRVAFLSMIENLQVIPGEAPARVVINSRTGTAVINRNVKVTAVAVTHGTISVRISATNEASQPSPFGGGETTTVTNTDISVSEENNPMFLFKPGVDLREIVDAVNEVGATPSSLIAILEALKSSGSLRAELVVI